MSANQEDRISRPVTSFILRGELQNYKTIVRHLFIDNNKDSEQFADNNNPDKPELDVDDDVNITNDLKNILWVHTLGPAPPARPRRNSTHFGIKALKIIC